MDLAALVMVVGPAKMKRAGILPSPIHLETCLVLVTPA